MKPIILIIVCFCKICCWVGLGITFSVKPHILRLCSHCVPSQWPYYFHLFLCQKPDTFTIMPYVSAGAVSILAKSAPQPSIPHTCKLSFTAHFQPDRWQHTGTLLAPLSTLGKLRLSECYDLSWSSQPVQNRACAVPPGILPLRADVLRCFPFTQWLFPLPNGEWRDLMQGLESSSKDGHCWACCRFPDRWRRMKTSTLTESGCPGAFLRPCRATSR